jgi:hypothetical protein
MITCVYDERIVPLLQQMSNLESLDLYLICSREILFDGNDLKINIINHMPRLNKFTFYIYSSIGSYNKINLPSNEDIQKTLRDFKDKQIISYVDYFPNAEYAQCHIYSYPYKLIRYTNITNNFPGGIFKYVREVSLFDERPFEHEFFLRTAQSFPLMENLSVVNNKRQIDKRFRKSKNENGDLSIIKYPNLKELHIIDTCKDYHEQFLFDTKTCLPFDVCVFMNYKLAKKVTRNFRRNATRSNCAKMTYVCLYRTEFLQYTNTFCPRTLPLPGHVKDYFPHAQIN